ncbi:MAG: hypothetical protein K8F62_10485, partial [Pseudorhodoplanes sp.]|nr:hypothetical protein [Pseudorhodoplanes sp.]
SGRRRVSMATLRMDRIRGRIDFGSARRLLDAGEKRCIALAKTPFSFSFASNRVANFVIDAALLDRFRGECAILNAQGENQARACGCQNARPGGEFLEHDGLHQLVF